MNVKYYSVASREQLDAIIKFSGNYYEDNDMIIDVIGKIDLNPPIELAEGEVDTRSPKWSDYLFNVLFKTTNKIGLFKDCKDESPVTPIRVFA